LRIHFRDQPEIKRPDACEIPVRQVADQTEHAGQETVDLLLLQRRDHRVLRRFLCGRAVAGEGRAGVFGIH
jgi:hypothetical protein